MRQLAEQADVGAAARLIVTAPFDGAVIAELGCTDRAQLESWLASAYALFRNRSSWIPLAERIGILERAARILLREKTRLALTAAHEGGKPLLDSQFEVERAIDGVKLAVEVLRTEAGEVIPMRATAASAHRVAFTQREPVGVVAAISAFNHPLNLIVHQVISAVAAGCPVLVKPSHETPLSCLNLVAILTEAGLPKQWCRVLVTEDLALAEALVTDDRIGFLSFIGSARVGWSLRSKLAPGVRCALEHGGAAPVIVAEDADWDLALPNLTKGAFYHAGQVCVSVQRIFVPRRRAQEFADQLATRASVLRLGDPRSAATEVGPLIRPDEGRRVGDWVSEAVDGGAVLVTGGKRIGRSAYRPTVLLDPAADATISQHEIFGPVACVYGYDSLEDAVARANSLPFAFQASVFTQDIDRAMHAFRDLDASAVMLNDDTAFRVDGMPFAGLRQSGLGTGGMRYSIQEMSVDKMLVIYSRSL
ncbi:MAG: aldehyde dehydrogenase family protein [Gammaproteobacteria bacterium]|jgi:acyl-CoA reductase-like NAD-dependent aldehyde dehydrogenase